jgi:excisionase family DNA binding protein
MNARVISGPETLKTLQHDAARVPGHSQGTPLRMPPIGDEAQLLTPKELASRLKVSERTVYREQIDGRIPGRLVRGKLRFYWPEVLKALPAAWVPPSVASQHRAGVDLVVMLKARARTWRGPRGKAGPARHDHRA